MTGSTSPWRQLRELAGDSAALQATWARMFVDAARAAGRGETADARELLSSLGSIYESYLRDVGNLNLRYAKALADLASDSGRKVGEAVDIAARRATHDVGAATSHVPGPVVAALPMSGPSGGIATGTFTVANTRDVATDLSFALGRLHDAADRGGAGVQLEPGFEPAKVRLAPGAEATVTVRVPLDRPELLPGHDYAGRVEVLGGDGTALDVSVHVEGSTPTKVASAPRARKTTRKTTKTTATKKAAAPKAADGPAG